MRRHLEVAFELLLERGERAVADTRELLDGDILEHMVVDYLFEVAACDIHIA